MNNAKKLTVEELTALPLASVVWGESRCQASLNDGTLIPLDFITITPFVVSGIKGGVYLTGCLCENEEDSFPVTFQINDEFYSPDSAGSVPTFWSEKPDMDMLAPGITEWQYDHMTDEELLQACGELAR